MTSGIDLWRAVDPEARLVSGSVDRLGAAIRGVVRTRAAPPHLPEDADGQLLVIDAALVAASPGLDGLAGVLRDAGLRPVAVVLAGMAFERPLPEPAGDPIPILVSAVPAGQIAESALRHLEHAEEELARVGAELRLAAAEAALVTPDPAAAAGLVSARLRRGVAVSADGEMRALHARAAGRALAARFAALHARLLAGSPGRAVSRQTREGLFLLERRIRPGASVWLFDDVPFARIDEVGAEALTITLRALLRRTADESRRPSLRPLDESPNPREVHPASSHRVPVLGPDATLRTTLIAVARANGRVAVAARELGVHRNTVLYRLRRASSELGLDPRRAEDALAILREAESPR